MKQQLVAADQQGHPIWKNTILSILTSGIGFLYPVLVFSYIARIFHPDGLGRVSFASSVTAYFVMFTGLGMPIYGLRAAARKQSSQECSVLVAELLMIRLLTGIAAWAVFMLAEQLFIGLAAGNDHYLLMVYGVGILAAIPECTWLYKGMEDYQTLAWTSAAGRLCGLVALFLFLRETSDIGKYAWIAVLVPMAVSVVELALADRKWNLHIIGQCGELFSSGRMLGTIKKHIRPLALFMLMSCAVTIYSHTDTVMLGLMQSRRVVGLYSCAAKIKSLLPVLTGALWAAALPKSAELWRNRRQTEFRELADKSFHVIYMVMLPLTVYFCLFAEPWTLLIGGGDYLDAVWTMRLLLLAVIPIGFSNIIGGQMLIPMGEEKKLFRAEAIGAVANIILNALLIPAFASSGAAIATTISETLVTVFAMLSALKLVRFHIFQPKNLLHSLLGCVVAGLATLGLVMLLGLPVYLRGPLSFLMFALLFGLTMLLLHDSLYHDMFLTAKKWYRRIVPECVRLPLGKVIRRIRSLFYRSEAALFSRQATLWCPCCGVRPRSFAAGNYQEHPEIYNKSRYEGIRQDIICPVCGALPRHRILAAWCDVHREELQAARILYFAPEYSMMCWMKRNKISCTTADLYAKADLKLDIQATGLPDSAYDIVFCNHVLEHVADFRAALKELYRILRPGGRLVCSFPMDPKVLLLDEEKEELSPEERIQRFGQYDHRRVFGMQAERFLADAGFAVNVISGESCPDGILPVIGPGDYDINRLFDCRKELS